MTEGHESNPQVCTHCNQPLGPGSTWREHQQICRGNPSAGQQESLPSCRNCAELRMNAEHPELITECVVCKGRQPENASHHPACKIPNCHGHCWEMAYAHQSGGQQSPKHTQDCGAWMTGPCTCGAEPPDSPLDEPSWREAFADERQRILLIVTDMVGDPSIPRIESSPDAQAWADGVLALWRKINV